MKQNNFDTSDLLIQNAVLGSDLVIQYKPTLSFLRVRFFLLVPQLGQVAPDSMLKEALVLEEHGSAPGDDHAEGQNEEQPGGLLHGDDLADAVAPDSGQRTG